MSDFTIVLTDDEAADVRAFLKAEVMRLRLAAGSLSNSSPEKGYLKNVRERLSAVLEQMPIAAEDNDN
jgi:hypothetical protein